MRNQFVTFKIALNLKEIGFDEPCLSAFDKRLETKGSRFFKMSVSGTISNDNVDSDTVAAPLWHQAMQWTLKKLSEDSSYEASFTLYANESGIVKLDKDNQYRFFNFEQAIEYTIGLI